MLCRLRLTGLVEAQVWDWGGNGYVHFTAEDCGRQTMGAVLENTVMQGALVDRLSKSAEVQLLSPVRPPAAHLTEWTTTARQNSSCCPHQSGGSCVLMAQLFLHRALGPALPHTACPDMRDAVSSDS